MNVHYLWRMQLQILASQFIFEIVSLKYSLIVDKKRIEKIQINNSILFIF